MRRGQVGFAETIGHYIVVIGVPAATVFAIARGTANQYTWLSLVSVLWYMSKDRVWAETLRTIASGVATRLSSKPGEPPSARS